jgi:CheY-like chemotaxis protein/predicted transcriptional regulator
LKTSDDITAQHYPIGSFTVDVLNRILTVLSDQGKTKRTNLAGKTGLNYIVCLRYINFMKTLGWLEVVSDEDSNEYVSVTPVGRRVGGALSDFVEGRDPDKVDYSDLIETRQKFVPSLQDSEIEVPRLEISPEPALKRESGARSKGARILLIDDEPDVALTYKSFLTSEGYTVDAFKEPERAVEHFISSRPMHYDLVITDIRMREMNGLRLYQCLKNIDPSVKVIFVTALDAADELVSVISPGPVQILKKPVEKQLFSKSVKAALQSAL